MKTRISNMNIQVTMTCALQIHISNLLIPANKRTEIWQFRAFVLFHEIYDKISSCIKVHQNIIMYPSIVQIIHLNNKRHMDKKLFT